MERLGLLSIEMSVFAAIVNRSGRSSRTNKHYHQSLVSIPSALFTHSNLPKKNTTLRHIFPQAQFKKYPTKSKITRGA